MLTLDAHSQTDMQLTCLFIRMVNGKSAKSVVRGSADTLMNRLGQVKADDVLRVIDAILAQPTRPLADLDQPTLPSHWRGRMGIGKDEQVALFRHYLS